MPENDKPATEAPAAEEVPSSNMHDRLIALEDGYRLIGEGIKKIQARLAALEKPKS